MKQPLLHLQNVCYSYDDTSVALNNVSVTVHRSERIAILGNNGAGKSTFFLLCNGVIAPNEGDIFYRGQKITRKKSDLTTLRRHVGIVFQEPDQQLIAPTVESEISFGPMNLRLNIEEVRQRVDKAITTMHLQEKRHRSPHNLSGGEKKQVTIADALAMEPEILLFDEPAASLDPANSVLLEDTLRELSDSGITLLVATHDMDFTWRWADRILVFHNGKIICDDLPALVFAQNDIIQLAGLRKPLLYEVMETLLPINEPHASIDWPKTTNDFRTFIKNYGSSR